MKTIVNLIGILCIGIAGILVYRIPYSKCNTPLTYTIGFIDVRFGLSDVDVVRDTKEAALMLSTAEGKQLFQYASTSEDLTINFNYDQRTALDKNVNTLEGRLNKQDTELQQQMNRYESDVKGFEQKVADLNATIEKYNNQNGAPSDVYANLISQQNQLKAEGDALNTRAKQLNLNTRDYNAEVQNLNQNITELQQAIAQKPEEGLYDGVHKIITVYFVKSKQELIHTLEHEFGHALGMNHVSNPQAIMYPSASITSAVTSDDKQQLDTVCRDIPLPEYWISILRNKLISF